MAWFYFRKRDLILMFLKALVGLALLASATACGPSHIYHGPSGFTADDKARTEEAFALMNERTGNADNVSVVWDDGEDGDNRILVQDPPDCPTSEFKMGTSSSARTIYVKPGVTGDLLSHAMAHELGHAHGLGHLPDGVPGLMAKSGMVDWNSYDVDACRAAGVCHE